MGMKYRDSETGQFKDLKVKTSDTLPIGTQVAYGGTIPPTGWLICDGSAVSRTTYAELFKVIGTSYGAGDGSTTFNLPNKKGRVSAGYDSTNSKFNTIGKKLGEETHTLTIDEMPQHTHIINTSSNIGGQVENMPWGGAIATQVTYTNAAGGNQPHNNIQPTEVDNWIIKAFQSIGVVGKVVNTKTNSDNDTYSCNYVNGIISNALENGTNLITTPVNNTTVNKQDIFTLVSTYKNYDFILVRARTNYNNYINIWGRVDDLEYWHNLNIYETDSYGAIGRFSLQNNNQLYLITTKSSGAYLVIDKIIGFKF